MRHLGALARLAESGRSIAIWGGTGKAAAMIAQYGLDAERFPVVVDSDPDKAGTYVPGTGQEIRFRDWLLNHPVAVILIATQWRAPDIVDEIHRAGISYQQILIEHWGRLLDFFRDEHPYRTAAAPKAAPAPAAAPEAIPGPHFPADVMRPGSALPQ